MSLKLPLGPRSPSRTPATAPAKQFHPYYQAAYDPTAKTLFCLSGGNVLHCFGVEEKSWRNLPPAPELEGLSWHTMACDPEGRRLVVVGADKKADNIDWSRTVVYDIPAGKWTRLEVADAKVVQVHRQFVAYAFTDRGEAWVLKINPKTARLHGPME